MKAELFSIKYTDRDAAALIYKKIMENSEDLGIIAHGLERYQTKSRRTRFNLKINLVLDRIKAEDLPSILKALQCSLEDHSLYPYLSFNYTAVPSSKTTWNFDSYDDVNYQKIFIRKRQNV